MPQRRNRHACDPIMRKGGPHVRSRTGQRQQARHQLQDEADEIMEERKTLPRRDRGNENCAAAF